VKRDATVSVTAQAARARTQSAAVGDPADGFLSHLETRISVLRRCALALLAMAALAASTSAAAPGIRAGSELDFRPYCFTDGEGQPTGFGPDLLKAVAEKMGLGLQITPGPWEEVWSALVAGNLDVLPIVARTPGREALVDFSVPHTETFDAFFVRQGQPLIRDLAAAAGREIVVMREDAAHHQLLERHFAGKTITVESVPDGLRLIAAGRHNAFLGSKLIGVLEAQQAGIKGVVAGPAIPDYTRVFSFGVSRGNAELLEKLNQGLHIVKADGTYDRIYRQWLGESLTPPPPPWQTRFWRVIGILGVLVLIGVTWVVARQALQVDTRQAQALTPPAPWAGAAFWRYALAVAAVAAGSALHAGLEAWGGGTLPRFITFYPAVMVVAVLGGMGPGLLATMLSAAFVVIWTPSPTGQSVLTTPVDRLALALFCVVNVFLTAVAELYRRNRAKAAAFDRAAALRESEERFRVAQELSPDGFSILRPLRDGQGRVVDFTCVYANPAVERMVGLPHAALPGRRLLDIHGERGSPFADIYRQVAETGQTRVQESQFQGDGPLAGRWSRLAVVRTGQDIAVHSQDITERKRADEHLRLSEETLTKIFQASAAAMALTRREDGCVIEVNDRWLDLTEYRREEVLGKTMEELGVWRNPIERAAMLREVQQQGFVRAFESIVRARSGRDSTVLFSAQPVAIRGEPMLVSSALDITAHRQAQDRLRESEQQLRQARDLLEAVTGGTKVLIASVDRDLRYTFLNREHHEEMKRLTGKDTAIGMSLRDVMAEMPEERDRALAIWNRALSGETVVQTLMFGDARRYRRWYSTRHTPVRDTAGEVIGAGEVTSDITELMQAQDRLRESEERFRQFMDNSPAIAWVKDAEGRYVYLNRAYEQRFGVTLDTWRGKTDFELWPADIAQAFRDHDLVVWREGQARQVTEQVRTADGALSWWLYSKFLITAAGGERYIAGSGVDITEQKRVEQDHAAATAFLAMLNAGGGLRPLLAAATDFFRAQAGCEAVGIRLKEGDDYPYCETRGFPPEFVQAENSLCYRDPSGAVQRDTVGNPVMACMCGNVICGRFDPAKPFFSPAGSFWTNSTTQLLASTTEADRAARTRNRCHGEGYESVALIPLCSGGERLGLVQLNDTRPGRFTAARIALWERLADYLAVAIAKARAEEALHVSEALLRAVLDGSPDAIFLKDRDSRLVLANPATFAIIGKPAAACLGKTDEEFYDNPADGRAIMANDRRIMESGQGATLEETLTVPTGPRYYLASKAPYRDAAGRIVGLIGIARDVTARKEAEEELRARNAELTEFNELMVDRELRMVELKAEINRLCEQIGQPARYEVSET
jgi:PAS domain S-box-containing protein